MGAVPTAKDPSATSMAVLGLLGAHPFTSYELTQQVKRSLGRFWPRAESNLYEASKSLVEAGFARARKDSVGRRERTTYAITAAGRRALARWVAQPARGPAVEFEGLVKIFFAEHGTRADLLAHLESARAQADAALTELAGAAATIAASGGAFPERQAQNTVVFRFVWAHTLAVRDRATESIAEVGTWADDPSAWPRDPAGCLAVTQARPPHRGRPGRPLRRPERPT